MLAGTVLIIAALSLFLYNRREARQAALQAERILPQVIGRIEENIEKRQARRDGETSDSHAAGEAEPELPDPLDPEMTVEEIGDYACIGYLSVPVLQLELPVLADWDAQRLKISPCRYTGSTRTDDLVIAGHNYAEFFGRLSDLSPGDQVYFVDMDGILTGYEVACVEVLAPTDIEGMTSGEYDLTLFTCTYDVQNRVAVRCDRVES